jgi:hypothetical protein
MGSSVLEETAPFIFRVEEPILKIAAIGSLKHRYPSIK